MHKQIDRKAPHILRALSTARIFKKQGRVEARQAAATESVTTTLASGKEETVNSANPGDFIVTNPSGERYVISAEKFAARYEATSEPGVYDAKGYCRAISNPFVQPIEIQASWGSPQQGDDDCLIADTCDATGKLSGEPYLIERQAFKDTYAEVKQTA